MPSKKKCKVDKNWRGEVKVTLDGKHISSYKYSKSTTIIALKKEIAKSQPSENKLFLLYKNNLLLCNQKIDDVIEDEKVIQVTTIKPKDLEINPVEFKMWSSRKEVMEAGVHKDLVNEISGDSKKCADSIIFTGENEYDEDHGNKILFTGLGQKLRDMYKALARNCPVQLDSKKGAKSEDLTNGIPVRVVRKLKLAANSPYKNKECYRYDGIYKVSEYRPIKQGKRTVWVYTLEREHPIDKMWAQIRKSIKSSRKIVKGTISEKEIVLKDLLDYSVHKEDLSKVKVFKHNMNENTSYSIVLSEDDFTIGNIIVFTGLVGKDEEEKQRSDAELTEFNKSLAESCDADLDPCKGAVAVNYNSGTDVRILKKYKLNKKWYTEKVGIYKVVSYWLEKNESGFKSWRYLLAPGNPENENKEIKKAKKMPIIEDRAEGTIPEIEDLIEGTIPEVEVGEMWRYRSDIRAAGVHQHDMNGIFGKYGVVAYSIVMSHVYKNNVDYGDIIIYTGCGKSSKNQTLTGWNQSLAQSCNVKLSPCGAVAENWKEGTPVRVIRKLDLDKKCPYLKKECFRYDGIYKVIGYWSEKGIRNKRIWRFLMKRDDPTPIEWSK